MKPLSNFAEGMKPAAFIFQESHLADFESDGSVLAFWADKVRPSAGTNKAALLTSIRSAWVSCVQLIQA